MFNNIGGKIKGLATVVTVLGMVASVIVFIAIWIIMGLVGFFVGALIGAIGFLVSWLGSFLLYGFGQLIESAENIEAKLNNMGNSPSANTPQAKYCKNCGAPTLNNDCICNSCKLPKPQPSVAPAPAPTPASEMPYSQTKNSYCKKCGALLPNGVKFCSNCKTYNM